MIGHWLNRTLQVWRPETTPDGSGGQTVTYVRQPSDVGAKVDQPSTDERILAVQGQSRHDHSVYLLPDADVRRGDELRGGGQTLRVISTSQPSGPRYLKAACELLEHEGA